MTTNTNAALREKLIDLIAEHLSGTYHCTRVWEAWNVGTMSQDDFEDVGESDTPAELADAILAEISTAAQPPADGALNTIAAMFHSGEEIEGPDGLAMMVDMSVWNDALDAFDEISGDDGSMNAAADAYEAEYNAAQEARRAERDAEMRAEARMTPNALSSVDAKRSAGMNC